MIIPKARIKKVQRVFISFLLALTLFITLFPSGTFAAELEEPKSESMLPNSDLPEAEPLDEAAENATDARSIPGELLGMREERAKYFRGKDGEITKAIYGDPVHYESSEGIFLDIDSRLILTGRTDTEKAGPDVGIIEEYRNGANAFDLRLSKEADQNSMVKLSEDDIEISFSAIYDPLNHLKHWKGREDEETIRRSLPSEVKNISALSSEAPGDPYAIRKNRSELTYKDAVSGVEYEYIPTGSGLKENIIVKDRAERYKYSFSLSLKGLSATLSEDGEIELKDEQGGMRYIFPAPFMYDSLGSESELVRYELKEIKNEDIFEKELSVLAVEDGKETALKEYLSVKEDGIVNLPSPESGDEESDAEPAPEGSEEFEKPAPETEDESGSDASVSEDAAGSETQGDEATVLGENGAVAGDEEQSANPLRVLSAENTAAENAGNLESGGTEEANTENPGVSDETEGSSPDPAEESEDTEGTTPEALNTSEEIEATEEAAAERQDDPTEETSAAEGSPLKTRLAEEKVYIFSVIADSAWINEEGRSFPVVIDPILKRDGPDDYSSGDVIWTQADKYDFVTGNYLGKSAASWKYVGRWPTGAYYYESRLRIDDIGIPRGALVTEVRLSMRGGQYDNEKRIALVDSGFGMREDGGRDILKPITAEDCIDYGIMPKSTVAVPTPRLNFYLTRQFSHLNGKNSLDVKFVPLSASTKSFTKIGLWNDAPYLTIKYKVTSGINDHIPAHRASAGRAGTGYVNDYAGYLSFVHGDSGTPGGRMPASVSHIYEGSPHVFADGNGVFDASDYTNAGNLWKLNYSQRLTFPIGERIESEYPYVWEDGDGSRHYFKKKDVKIHVNGKDYDALGKDGGSEDEDGLGLYANKITASIKSEYPYKITSKTGDSIMYFNKAGRLGSIRDSNQRQDGKNSSTNELNEIKINYETVPGATADSGRWSEIKALAEELLGLLNDTAWVNSFATTSLRNEYLLQRYLELDSYATYIYENDEFIRVNETARSKNNEIRSALKYLKDNSSATIATKKSKLTVIKNAVTTVEPIIAELDPLICARIDSVVDAAGEEIDIGYFDNGANEGRISYIEDPTKGGAHIEYEYDSSGNLTKITYPTDPGEAVPRSNTYIYDSEGRLISAKDTHGYMLTYGYGDSGKVEDVSESINGEEGGGYGIEYSDEGTKTVYTFPGSDDILSNSTEHPNAEADNIKTSYLFDRHGRINTAYSEGADGEFIGGGSYEYSDAENTSMNKLTEAAASGAHSRNYLKNHSFENGFDYWQNSYSSYYGKAPSPSTTRFIGLKGIVVPGGKPAAGTSGSIVSALKGYYQSVTLPAGRYTYSGYIKTAELSEEGGAYLKVIIEDEEPAASGTPLSNAVHLMSAAERGDSFARSVFEGLGEDDSDIESVPITSDNVSTLNSGWIRSSLNFTLEEESNVKVMVELDMTEEGTAGAAYFDALQLEGEEAAGGYNLFLNSSFEMEGSAIAPYGWSYKATGEASDKAGALTTERAFEGEKSFVITGEREKNKYLRIKMPIGAARSSFILSGWVYIEDIAPVSSGRKLHVSVSRPNGTVTTAIEKNLGGLLQNEWRYFSVAMPRDNYYESNISFYVNNMVGKIYIDDLQLIKESITKNEYDAAGNLAKKTMGASDTKYTNNGNRRVTSVTTATGNVFKNTYDDNTTDLLTTTSTVSGETTYMSSVYDKFGNVKTELITRSEPGENARIVTNSGYTDDGRYLSYTQNELGDKTFYTYDDETGLPLSVSAPGNEDGESITTETEYDYYGKATSVSSNDLSVNYEYTEEDRLGSIEHGGFFYTFSYDAFGNTTAIKAGTDSQGTGGTALVESEYAPFNGKLKKTTYGTGFTIEPVYDDHGHGVGEIWTEEGDEPLRVTESIHGGDGKTARSIDTLSNTRYDYEYDAVGRLRRGTASDHLTGERKHELETTMNNAGSALTLWYGIYEEGSLADIGRKYSYSYNVENKPIKVGLPNGSYKKYYYDGLKRASSVWYNPLKYKVGVDPKELKTSYTYHLGNRNLNDGGRADGRSNLLHTYTNAINGTAVNKYTLNYTPSGTISSIADNMANGAGTNTYSYDDKGRLIRENIPSRSETILYNYDLSGNITSVKTYPYTAAADNIIGAPISVDAYTYTATGWQDQMLSFNGDGIVYDEIGNPTEYLGEEFSWKYGRRLMGIGDDISYTYSAAGERLSKTVSGATTGYTYISGMLAEERTPLYTLSYYYDAGGALTSLGYTAAGADTVTNYFTVRNAQGDIIAIRRSSDSKLVGTYTYDSWGKVVSVNAVATTSDPDGILEKNPFRYRGYYYDSETGFYYLQSRYYDPEVRRFINADGFISTGTGLTGYNMYAYCNNNPINSWDPTGMCTWTNHGWIGHKVADCGSFSCPSSSCYGQTFGAGQGYGGVGAAPPTTPPESSSPPSVASAPVVAGSYAPTSTVWKAETSCGFGGAGHYCSYHPNGHYGQDYSTYSSADHRVYAVESGWAEVIRWTPELGNAFGTHVKINATDGVTDIYAHLYIAVIESGWVCQGQLIGSVGGTGYEEDSYFPHLHYEAQRNGVPFDPVGRTWGLG